MDGINASNPQKMEDGLKPKTLGRFSERIVQLGNFSEAVERAADTHNNTSINLKSLIDRSIDLPSYFEKLSLDELGELANALALDMENSLNDDAFIKGMDVYINLIETASNKLDRKNIDSEQVIQAIGHMTKIIELHEKDEDNGIITNFLLRIINSEDVAINAKVEAAVAILRNPQAIMPSSDESISDIIKDSVTAELLRSAQEVHYFYEPIIDDEDQKLGGPAQRMLDAAISILTDNNNDPELINTAIDIISQIILSDNAPDEYITYLKNKLLFAQLEDNANEAANALLFKIAVHESTPEKEKGDIAAILCFNNSGVNNYIREQAIDLLCELISTDTIQFNLVERKIILALRFGDDEIKETITNFLLRIIRSEESPFNAKIGAAANMRYGPKSDAQEEAFQFLLTMAQEESLDTKIFCTEYFAALINDPEITLSENLRNEILHFFADDILTDETFSEHPQLLQRVSDAIIFALTGNEQDDRFQAAQAARMALTDPNDAQNPYTIFKEAAQKREELSQVGEQALENKIPPTKDGKHKIKGSYLQMAMPTPNMEEMPNASHAELKVLMSHLETALQSTSPEVKQILVQDDEDVELKLNAMIQAFHAAIDSNIVKNWISPITKDGFNRSQYELKSVVGLILNELQEWDANGNSHQKELSTPAAKIFELLINITSCPSGKQTGVHLAAKQNGVILPSDSTMLEEQAQEPLKSFLTSQDEKKLRQQTAVTSFMKDVYDSYENLRLDWIGGDSSLMQTLTERSPVIQPSHQQDYLTHVLGNSLGLMREGEKVKVDLFGGWVSQNMREASGEDLLDSYLGQTVNGKTISDAVIDHFAKHWWESIQAGANERENTPVEDVQKYQDFSNAAKAMGINLMDAFEYEEDDDFNMTFTGLKREAVAQMLECLGILKAVNQEE